MRLLVLIFCLMPYPVFCQVFVDFESGIPADWVYDSDCWGLDDQLPLAGLYSLKHTRDNTESGTDLACLPLYELKVEKGCSWRFKLRHAYNPSSSNRWSLVLLSDKAPDSNIRGGTDNGIILGVNMEGYDDTLRLWKKTGGQAEVIVTSCLNWQNDIGTDEAPELIIERSDKGEWEIYICYDGVNMILTGNGIDDTVFASAYFGILYTYTSSCDRLLWLDDICISGYFEEDNTGPVLSRAEFIRSNTVRIYFNEPLRTGLLNESNFFITPDSIGPGYIEIINPGTIDLVFENPFKNKSRYKLYASDICDLAGNCSPLSDTDLVLACPVWGDIIITELMPDPDPPLSLPAMEYFEIFNTTDLPINLRSLRILSKMNTCSFPDHILGPGEYITVCDLNDTLLVKGEFPYIGLKSLPSLNNSADYIILFDTLSGTVHGVEYNESWRNNHFKNEGGWAFEMIDPSYPFSGASNWTFSNDSRGGTPSGINSVNSERPDIDEPYITNCFAASPSMLTVDFSEPVSDLIRCQANIKLDGEGAAGVIKADSLRRSYCIILADELGPGLLYTLDFKDIYDYANNSLSPSYCQAGLTAKAGQGDIIINEVLFDPLPGETEFIEFYNRSDRAIDASSLIVTCINLQSGDTGSVSYLSPYPRAILPGSYYLVCDDRLSVINNYFSSGPGNIFEPGKLPSLPDKEGRILLLRRDLLIIDDLTYSDDWHSDMISSVTGVSLERISPYQETNMQSNWMSASGLSGWATPGKENSVFLTPDHGDKSSLSLSSTRITPDNDGSEDCLLISFNLQEGEWLIDTRIYNDRGYLVNKLCDNLSAYGMETLIWHGTDNNGRLLPAGIYIVFAEAVSSSGEIVRWKKVCSVLRR